MIWYNDNEITIEFDKQPRLIMRYIYPLMSKDEVLCRTKYPFYNTCNFEVYIYDKVKEKQYSFVVKRGYTWDGATILKPFWSIIGSKTQPEFLIASCIHDYLCEHKDAINFNRKLSTKVFNCLLKISGVSNFKADLMCFFVDAFQRFCRW